MLLAPFETTPLSYEELVARGTPHAGGLQCLADAEKRGLLFGQNKAGNNAA